MNTNYFFKGLQTDMTTRVTPEGSYSFALNASVESVDGDVYSLSTEQGNSLSVSLGSGHTVLGHVLTGSQKIVVFSTDGSFSYINLYDPISQTIEILVKSSCLGFSTSHPVHALHSVKKGCDDVIYFTDNLNPYRVVNITSLQSYLPQGITPLAANNSDLWECGKFSLSRDYQIPTLDLESVEDSSGELKVGTVQFAIQYLDSDLNETNWLYVTNPIAITNGTSWNNTTGPINIPVGAVDIPEGAVPATTKSIRLSIGDLDQSFSYFRLAALHATSGSGAISEVYLLDTVPISSTQAQYTYAGPNLNNASVVSISDIQIDAEKVDRVRTHAIAGNNLYLANLSGVARDYSALQRAANKIYSHYVTKLVEPYDRQSAGDPKSANTYFDTRTFMPDEVYAFAIEFIYEDGSVSPAFHIPGRNTVVSSTEQALVSDPDETEFLGGTPQPRWKVYSTPVTTTPTGDFFREGWMGYHESDSAVYPEILDCDGVQVYDEDYWGTPLAGTPVRHHRFPSRASIPATITQDGKFYIQPIGIRFDNIVYPTGDIISHRILMAKRDEYNKTVLDNGFLSQVHYGNVDNDSQTYYVVDGASSQGMSYSGTTSTASLFVSPRSLLKKENFGGTHLSLSGRFNRSSDSTDEELDDLNPYNALGFLNPDINMYTRHHMYDTSAQNSVDPKVVSYNAQVYVDPSSKQAQIGALTSGIINTSFTMFYPVVQMTNRSLLDTFIDDRLYVASIKKYKDVYNSLPNLTYIPLTHNPAPVDAYFNGDTFITPISWLSVTEYQYSTGTPPPIVPIGNPFIGVQLALWFLTHQSQNYYGEYISNVWVDSDINFSLRYAGQDECNKIYQGDALSKYFIDKMFFEVVKDDVDAGTVKIRYKPREFACNEYFAYNNDFSKLNVEKPSFPVSGTFDYCSDCFDRFPYRIRVSKKGFQEESKDNFRVFLPLAYSDLEGGTGEVTALRTYNDYLYALTTKACYVVPVNAQTIQTNETTAFLGTGEELSIPAKKIISAPYSYGGTLHQLSAISTEFGVLSVDSLSGKVFLISQSVSEISNNGMKNFFEENLPLSMSQSYSQNTSMEYPLVDATTHPYGVGILSYYDPRHRRIIITKKDFLPLFSYSSLDADPPGVGEAYWWDETRMRFVHRRRDGYVVIPELSNPEYFENKSFTISFHVPSQSWISFHSYTPYYAFMNAETFFSCSDADIYEHYHEVDFLNFYGDYYQFVLDYPTFAGGATSVFHSILVGAEALQYHPSTKKYYLLNDVTFDRLWAYNSYQSTGLQNVAVQDSPFDIVTYSADSVPTKRVDSQWRINELRDYVIDRQVPVESSAWSDIQDDYFIDKVPNPGSTSVQKSQYETERLKDQYLSTRLYFDGRPFTKLRTDYIHTKFKPSYR